MLEKSDKNTEFSESYWMQFAYRLIIKFEYIADIFIHWQLHFFFFELKC